MDQLHGEILQYEAQLSQIQLAISASSDGPEKLNLLQLESDIKELIALTKGSLEHLEPKNPAATSASNSNDPLLAEYALFKAELAEFEEAEEQKNDISEEERLSRLEDLRSDLKELEGMKCQAPYTYSWSDVCSYHNALVFCVDSAEEVTDSDNIKVKVMFTNPTHKDMLPCPFFLDGSCKFSDEKCRFSHGETVLLSSLKEFKEPDFGQVTSGCTLLVKQADNLWHRAVALSMKGESCEFKLESNSKIDTVHLQNVLPLDGAMEDEVGNEASDSDSEDLSLEKEELEDAARRVLSAPPSSALGEWERFTKGFGSRIMAQLGYVVGDGLGVRGNGRVEPVPAVILPAGKSLDYCMALRDNAGGDPDLFKAERKMKRKQKKHEEAMQRAYQREKKKTDVFTFLNSKLTLSKTGAKLKSNLGSAHLDDKLKGESSRNLSVTSLQLAEEVKRTEKEIKTLNESLARHSSKSPAFAVLTEKLHERQSRLSQLQATERRVSNEQEQRRDRKKLVIF